MFKKILISYVPQIVTILTIPITIKILTNNLTIDEFGSYSLIHNLANYLIFIGGFGCHRLLAKKIPGRESSNQYKNFFEILSFELISFTIFLCIFFFTIIPNLHLFGLDDYKTVIIVFFAFNGFYLVYNEIMRFLGFQKKIELKSILTSFDKPLIFLSLIVILYLGPIKIEKIFLGYSIVFFLLFFISLQCLNNRHFNFKKPKIDFQKTTKILFPLFLIDLVFKSKELFPRYILSFYETSNEVVGIYALYENYSRIFYLVVTPFIFVLYPYISSYFNQNQIKSFTKLLKSSTELSIYAFFTTSIIGIIYLEELIVLLSNNSYLSLKNYSFYFFINYFFVALISIFQPILILKETPKKLMIAYFIIFVINVISSFILIHFLKFEGAILSRILINGLIFFILSTYLSKILGSILDIFSILKILVYISLIFLITIITKNGLEAFFIFEILLLTIFLIVIFYLFQNKNIKQVLSTK